MSTKYPAFLKQNLLKPSEIGGLSARVSHSKLTRSTDTQKAQPDLLGRTWLIIVTTQKEYVLLIGNLPH